MKKVGKISECGHVSGMEALGETERSVGAKGRLFSSEAEGCCFGGFWRFRLAS